MQDFWNRPFLLREIFVFSRLASLTIKVSDTDVFPVLQTSQKFSKSLPSALERVIISTSSFFFSAKCYLYSLNGGQRRVRAFLSLASEFCSSGFKLDERPPLNPLLGLRPFVKENNKESPFKVLPWNNTKRPQFCFDFKPSFRWLFLKLAPIF